MNYTYRSLERIARDISSNLEGDLIRAGIFYRIFFRCKSEPSLEKKLSLTLDDGTLKYDGVSKFLRDIIGIRINLYFVDDLEIITDFFRTKYKDLLVEETIDQNTTTEFKPTRVNLIFRLLPPYDNEFKEILKDRLVDNTFELQLRTVFSEGWHEVEHDLRYKSKEDWSLYPDMSRNFNGILAALETNEWSIIQMFERLSYCHYKSSNFSAMIRTKFRIRVEGHVINEGLLKIFSVNDELKREYFKLERQQIVALLLSKRQVYLLSNLNNFIYFVNYFFIKNEEIKKVSPSVLIKEFEASSR